MNPIDRKPENDRLPPRILVIDDHPVYVEGLLLTLQRVTEESMLHACQSSTQALQLLRYRQDFDLLLVDYHLPDGDGVSLALHCRQLGIDARIVLLSASDDVQVVKGARQSGADGFISKACHAGEILKAIESILRGTPNFPPLPPDTGGQEEIHLTQRQMQVLQLLAQGLPNKKICTELGLTEHTIKTHIKALFNTLGVHNRTECVSIAQQIGLITT